MKFSTVKKETSHTMSSVMAGQKIGLLNKIASSWKIFRSYRRGVFGNSIADIKFHNELKDVIKEYLDRETAGLNILDLGCGQMAKQTVLFKSDGANAVGIDVEIPTYHMNITTFIKVAKENGFERALKSLFRHLFFDRAYIKHLSAQYGQKMPYSNLDIRIMSATSLNFPDNFFHFIFSQAVFEHIDDVPLAVKEVSRVLHKSGIAWIGIHLFPSLSGGHNPEWLFPDKLPSRKVPAWDHLLEMKYPPNAFLNKLKLNDYRKIFADNMVVVGEQKREEGASLLSPDLEIKLRSKGFSKEDLITKSVVFICRKK